MTRDEPDAEAWLARLKRRRIDYLAFRGIPHEALFVELYPRHFELLFETDTAKLYRFIASPP